MSAKIIELKPNNQLIDPEFNGYKLSLDNISILKKQLQVPVSKIYPEPNNYSYLHAKLIGLHNHLVGESVGEVDIVYFIDESQIIKRILLKSIETELTETLPELTITNVFSIPKYTDKLYSNNNVSLKFVSDSLALLSDKMGKLYILQTGNRTQEENCWKCLFCENVVNDRQCFVIQDVRFQHSNGKDQIHCLLYSIAKEQDNTKFANILFWITLTKIENNTWKKTESKKINTKSNSEIYYAYLETSCEALYIISDGCLKFEQDLCQMAMQSNERLNKQYRWNQTLENITVKLQLPENTNMDSIYVNTDQTKLCVMINDKSIINGELYDKIDNNLTSWSIDNEILEINLLKENKGNMWNFIIQDDDTGDYIVDTLAVELQDKLSEKEIAAPLGATFSSQQVEECDFEDTKYTSFERISYVTFETTHKVIINTHTLVLTVKMNESLVPALAFRHDVDAIIWQPRIDAKNFSFVHEATLNAFGYVQASKTQRKFSVCAPDLNYCAICETSRHIFIYRQQVLKSGELRHRSTGKRIDHTAQQQVVNLANDDEILGVYAATTKLFLLTSKHIYVLKL